MESIVKQGIKTTQTNPTLYLIDIPTFSSFLELHLKVQRPRGTQIIIHDPQHEIANLHDITRNVKFRKAEFYLTALWRVNKVT